jgi:hypothetical protein
VVLASQRAQALQWSRGGQWPAVAWGGHGAACLSGRWCPGEMLRRDGHGVKKLCQVVAAQAAHAHTMERLGATEAHVRQVAGGVVLRRLLARRLSGASWWPAAAVASWQVAGGVVLRRLSARRLSGASWWPAAAVASRQVVPAWKGTERLQKGALGLAQAWSR